MADRNRITQLAVEAITEVVSKTRITQLAVEAITEVVSKTRITQLAVEVITGVGVPVPDIAYRPIIIIST